MNASIIRKTFLDFFKDKQHEIVPSSPMVIKNDPTLMFTNAGMVPFKEIFLGNQSPKNARLSDTQKCLRVSGKHNDLEEVGHDTYHHTMFEMLGNWSFGDYFKEEAIAWAWELLTEVYKIDKDSLYVTVFGGDEADGLAADEEARSIWKKYIDPVRILNGSKKDNFWEMGDQGPCGPCSEIHVDIRSADEKAKVDGASLVNEDHPQVIEIWNLVFMEFNRMANGSLQNLPNKHVDTGMGFERLCMVLQGKQSNYDTDVFQPYIQALAKLSGKEYGKNNEADIAMRVMSDHIRAIAFAIADGQLPSNAKAGYVIRRILRRAVRYGYTFLGFQEPVLYRLVGIMADTMGDAFPELVKQEELIAKVVKEEESSFLRTLSQGLNRIELLLEKNKSLSGEQVFELYDTYGFPLDLTQLILKEKGLNLDEQAFHAEMQKQKDRSKADAKQATSDWLQLKEDEIEEFVGYDRLEADVFITKYREVEQKGKKQYQLVLNLSPFYAEAGGQVGDTGYLINEENRIEVINTQKESGLIIHITEELPANLEASFKAVVNGDRRRQIMRNHSATHLLHFALRKTLGEHVEQKGSLVHPDYLRFDFSHFSKLSREEFEQVEQQVNEAILENIALTEKRNVPMTEAQEMGAMALFGEKYGDTVRVIQFGESVELCGGTHVQATGAIGAFVLKSESAVAAGVRRIEALTGMAALQYLKSKEESLNSIANLVKNPSEPIKGVEHLIAEKKKLEQELKKLQDAQAANMAKDLASKAEEKDGFKQLIARVDLDAGALKKLSNELEAELSPALIVLAGAANGKAAISLRFSESLCKEKGYNAGKLIKSVASHIQGGGGGPAHTATAGGKNPEGVDAALSAAKEELN